MPPMTPPAGMPTPEMGNESAPPTNSRSVLLTVSSNGDGTYTLTKGGSAGGAAPEMGEGGAPEPTAAGETYDSIGALLKGVMDIVKADSDTVGGEEGSPEENFSAGFTGNPRPKKAPGVKPQGKMGGAGMAGAY